MKKPSSEVALGLFILAAAGLLGYMSLTIGGLRLGHGVHVKAEFGNAAGLVKDAAVMIAGVEVGKVEGLKVKHDKAEVSLFVREEAGVRQDAIAAIRAKSLLGEKYLELRPQSTTAPLLKDGDVLAKTEFPLEMDQLVNSAKPFMDALKPEDVQKLVRTLAKTVERLDGADLDKLGKMIDDAAFLLAKGREIAGDPQLAADLTKLRTVGVKLVNEHGDDIGRILQNGDKLVAAIGPEADHVASALAKTDRLMTQLDSKYLPLLDKWAATGEKLRPTIEHLPVIVGKLEPTLDKVPTFLVKLEPTLDKLPTLVGKIDSSIDKMQPLLKMTQEAELRKFIQKEGIKINFF